MKKIAQLLKHPLRPLRVIRHSRMAPNLLGANELLLSF